MSKLARGILLEGLADIDLPTSRVDKRKISIDEIKNIVLEEFGKAKDAKSVKVQDQPKGWGDAELEKEIDWVKKLDLKEFFIKS